MAKFSSDYAEQISPEEDDMLLMSSGRDGSIMKVSVRTLSEKIGEINAEMPVLTDAQWDEVMQDE